MPDRTANRVGRVEETRTRYNDSVSSASPLVAAATTSPVLASAFAPAWPLHNGHAQTIWPVLCRRVPRLVMQDEIWEFPDREPLAVTLLERPEAPAGVIVLHGLEGSVETNYMRGMLAALHGQGWNVAAFDFRSCGRSAARMASPRTLYHSGKTDDFAAVLARLGERWAGRPLGAVGFSMGGNVLLKWLGETGAAAALQAAVAISVPFDLGRCARTIDGRGMLRRVYRERFLRSLRRKALALERAHAVGLDPRAIAACRTFADYDRLVTAPLFGYASNEDYWTRNSSVGFLKDIHRPTLLVSAADDPFVPEAVIPRAEIASNPALTSWIAARGGHVGFVTGRWWRGRYLAEELAVSFLRARLAEAG